MLVQSAMYSTLLLLDVNKCLFSSIPAAEGQAANCCNYVVLHVSKGMSLVSLADSSLQDVGSHYNMPFAFANTLFLCMELSTYMFPQ